MRSILTLLILSSITFSQADAQWGTLLRQNNVPANTEEGYELMHSKKVEALVEIADTSTEPLLVAYNFKSDLAEIKKAIPGRSEGVNVNPIRGINHPGYDFHVALLQVLLPVQIGQSRFDVTEHR